MEGAFDLGFIVDHRDDGLDLAIGKNRAVLGQTDVAVAGEFAVEQAETEIGEGSDVLAEPGRASRSDCSLGEESPASGRRRNAGGAAALRRR